MRVQVNLDRIVRLLYEEFQDSLTGIYLHGSLALGCFHSAHSDIDLLVIVKSKQSIEAYQRIASGLLQIEEELDIVKGIELSIILESHVAHFVYPTPFEFHYSATHREKYRTDPDYLCGGFEDPDLAAHFVVTYHRGIVLYGEPIQDIFKPIDKQYFISSIKSDVDGATEGIIKNPEYYVLNLCRALLFMREEVIASKKEGGEWAIHTVPVTYVELINLCLAKYNGVVDVPMMDDQLLLDFAQYMLHETDHSIV